MPEARTNVQKTSLEVNLKDWPLPAFINFRHFLHGSIELWSHNVYVSYSTKTIKARYIVYKDFSINENGPRLLAAPKFSNCGNFLSFLLHRKKKKRKM